MLYAMVRAIIQDLRATAFRKNEDMGAAYDLAMSQPSEKSLRYCASLPLTLATLKHPQFTSCSKVSSGLSLTQHR